MNQTFAWMRNFGEDVRFWRQAGLGARQGYAAFTVLVLALGIGTVTAMFTIAYAVLLKPLPFEADRSLYQPVVKTMVGSDTESLSYDEIREWQQATQGTAEVAFNGGGLNIADGAGGCRADYRGESEPEPVSAVGVPSR